MEESQKIPYLAPPNLIREQLGCLKFTWVPGEEDQPIQYHCGFCGAEDITDPDEHALQSHGTTSYTVKIHQ